MDNIVNAPELEWLKANSVHSTPEGVNTTNKEYLRTWCSINLLKYVLEGNYKAFSSCQKEGRITLKSFNEMINWVKNSLRTPELEDAMRAFLVINDLGKIGDFVEKVKEATGFESIDHDSILYEGLKAHLVVPHCHGMPVFHVSISSLQSPFAETLLLDSEDTARLFLGEPPVIDGYIDVPDTPGLGYELNYDWGYMEEFHKG